MISLNSARADDGPCCHEENNWYVGFTAEGVLPSTVDIEESLPIAGPVSYDLHMGYGIMGVVGYQLFKNASIELEVAMRQWEVDAYNPPAANPAPNGTFYAQESKSVMLNHIWTYRSSGNRIMPYAGVGAGATFTNPAISRRAFGEVQTLKDIVFTYQLMGGLAYALPDTDVELYTGYRYVGMQDAETSYHILPAYKVSYNMSSHNIDLGARLHF